MFMNFMIFIYYIVNILFYFSVCGFCLNYGFYLKSLIMIEFTSVSVVVVIITSHYGSCHYVIYILILVVCEGVVGLVLMVVICRSWGVDYYFLVDYNL